MNKDKFPCDSCICVDKCANMHECQELRKFKKNNPLSLRERPTKISLMGVYGKEEYTSEAKVDTDKKIKCPACGEVMREHLGQGSIDFNPLHLVSSEDLFPESINCVITIKYACLCGAVLFIPESKTYKNV